MFLCMTGKPDIHQTSWSGGTHPVLLDIIMPELNGIEVLKILRTFELLHCPKEIDLFARHTSQTSSFCRIIMQTSSEDINDFLSAYKEGKCNGFINKPYSKDEILEKVLGRGNERSSDVMALIGSGTIK